MQILHITDFDKKNLLEPGWAGELNSAEQSYIKAELKQSPRLKGRWGIRPSVRCIFVSHFYL